MALPLPYAPNIDVDAEKLRMAQQQASRPAIDVGAGVGPAIQGAITLKDALDARDAKAAAAAFQSDYLQKGNAGIQKMYVDAGSPKDFNINAYLIPDGTPPDKAQEIALLAAKDLATQADKAKADAATSTFADLTSKGVKQADGTFRPATQDELDAAEVAAGTASGQGYQAIKGVADRGARAKIEADKQATAQSIADLRAKTQKSIANVRQALAGANDASVIAAIQNENDQITALSAEQDSLQEKLAGMTTYQKGSDKVIAPRIAAIDRELAAINARVSGYITKVRDPSKVPKAGDKKGTYNPATGKVEYK